MNQEKSQDQANCLCDGRSWGNTAIFVGMTAAVSRYALHCPHQSLSVQLSLHVEDHRGKCVATWLCKPPHDVSLDLLLVCLKGLIINAFKHKMTNQI